MEEPGVEVNTFVGRSFALHNGSRLSVAVEIVLVREPWAVA